MEKTEIFERLESSTPERLLGSPYARHAKLDLKTIQNLKSLLKEDPGIESIKPLLLADVSLEIQSLSINSFQELSDEEIAKRAISAVDNLLESD
jgi:hypothetical protein